MTVNMKKEERNIYIITLFLVLLIWILPVLIMKQEVRQEKEIERLEQSITAINDNGCK
jgi:preprotein translocase subunit YajC